MNNDIVTIPQPENCYTFEKYSPYKENIKYFVRKYGLTALMIVILFLGMIFGAVKSSDATPQMLKRIDIVFLKLLDIRSGSDVLTMFLSSFAISFIFMLLMYISSLSPLGIFFVPAIMFFRGFEYGIASGFLCINYGLKGLAYYITVILSGAFVSSLALMCQAQYCMEFSSCILWELFDIGSNDGISLKSKLGTLTLNAIFMTLLLIFASLLDTFFYYLIGGVFKF